MYIFHAIISKIHIHNVQVYLKLISVHFAAQKYNIKANLCQLP